MLDPKDSEAKGFHIFLVPTGSLYSELEEEIQKLATTFAGPVFIPHVTLLANIDGNEKEVLEKAKVVAAESMPITLTLGALASEDEYFRALYIQIENSEQLLALHVRAGEVYGATDDREFKPHISLLYGNYLQSVKEEIISNFKFPQGDSCTVNSLQVYRTEGEVSNWKKVGEFEFHSNV